MSAFDQFFPRFSPKFLILMFSVSYSFSGVNLGCNPISERFKHNSSQTCTASHYNVSIPTEVVSHFPSVI